MNLIIFEVINEIENWIGDISFIIFRIKEGEKFCNEIMKIIRMMKYFLIELVVGDLGVNIHGSSHDVDKIPDLDELGQLIVWYES